MSFDVSRNYTCWVNRETATVVLKRSSSTTTLTVTDCKRQMLRRRDVELTQLATQSDGRVWKIPQLTLDAAAPASSGRILERGDKITGADGLTWYVEDAAKHQMADSVSHWRCVTVKER